jgi:uncharacterized protein (DUF1501 family)
MDSTGFLDETVVMVSSEFGRTPKNNNKNGRDHWPKVFSVVMAGGGFVKGQIYGASDATAAEPDSQPIGPADLFATVYRQLGIDYTKRLLAPGDRPIDIVRNGKHRSDLVT